MKNIPGGICFDFNGVIVDDERHHCDALIGALAEQGVPLDRDTFYREFLGHDDRACFVRGFAAAGRTLDETQLTMLHHDKNARYQTLMADDMTLVPGVTDFIFALLQRESPLAIASSAPRHEIDYVLRRSGLDECFTTIIAAGDVDTRKPSPEPYQRACMLLGLSPSRCVAIEDSLIGLASARTAGIPVLMLTTSWAREALEAEAPAAVWEDFSGRRPEELPWNG